MAADTPTTTPGRVPVPGPVLALGIVVIILAVGAMFFAGTVLAPGPSSDAPSDAVLTAPALPQSAIDFPGGGRLVLDNIWIGDNGPNAVVRVEGGLDDSAANWTFVTTDGVTLVPRDSDHGNGNTLLWLDRPLPASTSVGAIRYKSGENVAEFQIE
ncbi:MAG: hypothetical protein R3B97_00730 [Dehalococcoidia bacterium]